MQKLITLLVFTALALSLGGCHFIYTPDVQQGNLFDKSIDQKAVDQLQPGLTKTQVLALLGTPSVSTPFDQNRWDYVSSMSRRGGPIKVNTMSLFFNNDALVRTEGSLFSQDAQDLLKDSKKYHANYPVNETEGDKSQAPDKKDGGMSGGGKP